MADGLLAAAAVIAAFAFLWNGEPASLRSVSVLVAEATSTPKGFGEGALWPAIVAGPGEHLTLRGTRGVAVPTTTWVAQPIDATAAARRVVRGGQRVPVRALIGAGNSKVFLVAVTSGPSAAVGELFDRLLTERVQAAVRFGGPALTALLRHEMDSIHVPDSVRFVVLEVRQ